jgi:undecaprenyl-diphosphatase
MMLEALGSTIVDRLFQADVAAMLQVNREWTSPLADKWALLWREPLMHIPLYIFLIFISFRFYKQKGWWWLLIAVLLVSTTDMLSSQLIKSWVGRVRPCRDPEIAQQIRLLASYCGANGSFTSSHAFNHFALANFAFLTLRDFSKWFWVLYVWAFFIAYAQVYVGVHYPSDVMGGALMGMFFGWLASRIASRTLSLRKHTI